MGVEISDYCDSIHYHDNLTLFISGLFSGKLLKKIL